MGAITLGDFKIVKMDEHVNITVKSGEDVSSGRRGMYMRIDGTTGKAVLGNATSSGEVGNVHGIALETQKYVGDTVTLARRVVLDFGDGLDGMDYGDPIYLSDTDGTFSTTAGTVSTIVGYVIPCFETDGTVTKLADIKLV